MQQTWPKLIEKEYGITIQDLETGPRQFVAETYILTTQGNQKYFVKIVPDTRYSANIKQSLPILEQLYKLGVTHINYPIETKEGGLFISNFGVFIILFNYIPAKQTFDFDIAAFATLLASIHQKTKKITAPITKETFTPDYINDVNSYLERVFNEQFREDTARRMQELLLTFKEEIQKDWEEFAEICNSCKNTTFDFILTHGDAPGNILVDDARSLYLVDWDDIKLAPTERDTWFLKDRPGFLEAYRCVFPDYHVNKLAYSFYLHNRYWEDLLGFIEEILSDQPREHKLKNLQQLKHDCFEWLRPLIRKLS